MISHQYRFIFVHAGRTGGSSLERMAGIEITTDERTRDLGNTDFPEKHKNFQYFRSHYPKEFQAYFKFTLVRNPFDRLVSAWLWRTNVIKDISPMPLSEFVLSRPDSTKYSEKFSLEGLTIQESISRFNFIGRFEELENALFYLRESLNLPGSEIPHVNKTSNYKYQDYYDLAAIEAVRLKYSLDLELFGYDF